MLPRVCAHRWWQSACSKSTSFCWGQKGAINAPLHEDLRLEEWESQEQLGDLLKRASDGMSACRKEMVSVNNDDLTPEAVEDILQRARPYILAYQKYAKTAKGLPLG